MKKIFLLLTIFSLNSYSFDSVDTLFKKQWALENTGQVILKNISELERVEVKGIPGVDIHWQDTSNLASTTSELIVAVLDSGVDIDHPDLKDRITKAKWNFLDNNNNVSDDMGHGTHVAGIIAANKNSIGIVGAADPRVKIMPIKVLNSQVNSFVYNGKLITDIIADAMVFAINNGAQVINLSLGWPKLIDTAKVRNAFLLAEEKNVLVVAAAGNNNKDLPTFPCAYESVVCVGAIDNRGVLSDFSNFGSKVDVVAPGEYIVSTFPRILESRVLRIKNYEVKRGSSQAAPFVTSALATLKLFNNELSNNRLRSILFNSTKKLSDENSRYVKFGSLDMKAMLATKANDKTLLSPLLKNITEVRYKISDKRFNINLSLKNISDLNFKGTVCVEINSTEVVLDQPCFEISEVLPDAQINLSLMGTINKLDIDSHLLMRIQAGDKEYNSTVVFVRDLNTDIEIKTESVVNANFDEMALISGERKISKMSRVFDKFRKLSFPEYYFLEKTKQTENLSVISLLTKEGSDFKIKSINIPRVNRVLTIHRQDINLDGKLDYFIYALSANKDQLLFISLDENLMPLFGKLSTWSFPLSTFEGLPIDGGQEKFDWLQINNKVLGKILVPSFLKTFELPEVDNSKNILDRVIGKTPRLFFFNPIVNNEKVTLETRVLDSVNVIKNIRQRLEIFSDQNLTLIKNIPQTKNQNSLGVVHALFSTSDDNGTKFLEIFFNDQNVEIKSLNTDLTISDSLIYPIVNSDEFILTTLLNRSSAEFLVLRNSSIKNHAVLTKDWENPIMGMIAAFTEDNFKTLFVESRSTVTLMREGQLPLDLPIYRDSSFPGQNFSETLSPVLVAGQPGIFVNSTLIFGERIYAMVANGQEFIRPMNLSVAIPEGCVPLSPEIIGDRSSYNFLFLCTNPSKQVFLKILPMSMN